MDQTLADCLNEVDADAATLQHAVRYAVAELSDYKSVDEMKADLLQAASPTEVDSVLGTLSSDGNALLDLDLAVLLALLNENPVGRQKVRSAIAEAKDRLPIVEAGLIALCAMYAMYLLSTGGRVRTIRRVVKTKNGWEEREEVEFASFSEPVKSLVRILGLNNSGDERAKLPTRETVNTEPTDRSEG